MRLWVLLTAATASLVLTSACANTHHDSRATITGRLMGVGGPPPGTAHPLSGTVHLENVATHATVVIRVGPKGRYSALVSAGTYEVTAHSPWFGSNQYGCSAQKRVTATAKATAAADVYCQYP